MGSNAAKKNPMRSIISPANGCLAITLGCSAHASTISIIDISSDNH